MKKISTHLNSSLFALLFISQMIATQAMAATPPSVGIAGDPVFLLGPMGQALGGATYSMKATHDNLLTNSAAGAFSGEYAANGSFSTAARTIGASVFDTKSTSYGGGFTYLRREVETDDAQEPLRAGTLKQLYQNFGLSLFGKLHEMFAIGVTGKYSMRENTGSNDLNGESWNADVGVSLRLSDKIGFGAVYKNLFGDSKNIEFTVLAGGADIEVYPGLVLTGAIEKYSQPSNDPRYGVPNEDDIVWALGAQYKHNSGVVARAGFRDSAPWDSQIAFGGLGYVADSFHIDYAFGTVTDGVKFNTHTFGLGAVF